MLGNDDAKGMKEGLGKATLILFVGLRILTSKCK
jgi:hypothetical protein